MSTQNPTQNPKRMFFFHITYFKPSGKYYSEEDFWYPCIDCGSQQNLDGTIGPVNAYMSDVTDYIRSILHSTREEKLPGLSSSNWQGYIVITCADGVPCLIDADKENE